MLLCLEEDLLRLPCMLALKRHLGSRPEDCQGPIYRFTWTRAPTGGRRMIGAAKALVENALIH